MEKVRRIIVDIAEEKFESSLRGLAVSAVSADLWQLCSGSSLLEYSGRGAREWQLEAGERGWKARL